MSRKTTPNSGAPGQRYDEWSEDKRRDQRRAGRYAETPETLHETDLTGRHYPGLEHRKGPHEGLAGASQDDPTPGDAQFQPADRATQKHDPPPDDAVPEQPPEGEREASAAKTRAARVVKKKRD